VIPARSGIRAQFKYEDAAGKTLWDHKRVVAFNDDGEPLVVGKHGLHRADDFTGYVEVDDADNWIPLGVVPGGGWFVVTTQDDGTEHKQPVIAWVVNEAGYADAVVSGGDCGEPIAGHSGSHMVCHPDEQWRKNDHDNWRAEND
jgi:hypothetical protein